MITRFAVFLILFFCGKASFGQLGGDVAFPFVFNAPSPRCMALGGTAISQKNRDLGLTYQNPALLDGQLHNKQLQISYSNFIEGSDMHMAYVSYATEVPKIGQMAGHIFVTDYAKLQGFDETGLPIGEFNATDYVFKISNAQKLNENLRIGGSVIFLYSAYERYVATAFGLDAAVLYSKKEKNIDAGLVIRNLGYNAIPYDEIRTGLPFEIMVSASKKLEHNPLRLTIIGRNLQKWDLTYQENLNENQEIDLSTGEVIKKEATFLEKGMRHIGLSAEFLFSENFHLIFAYNHQRRKEMALSVRGGFTGFSWGLSINVRKYQITFANGGYFLGKNAKYFSIQKKLSDFSKH